jgi:hypothetical protein
MMKRHNIIIIALLAVIVFVLFFKVGKSYFSPAPAPAPGAKPSVADVKTMISSGMPEMNVIISLIKSGVPSDQAEQLVSQAKAT